MAQEPLPPFCRMLAEPGPRHGLFHYLQGPEILDLRLIHPFLARTIVDMLDLFTLRLNFTPRTLSSTKLTALKNAPFITHGCNRLIINFAHTYETEIRPAERDRNRVYPTIYLIPSEGRLADNFTDFRLDTIPPHDYGPLFDASRNAAAFTEMFHLLPNLQATHIRTPGTPAVIRGHAVDQAVLSVRTALETVRRPTMGYLEFKGHAGGLLMLTPAINWSGVGFKRAWWEFITRFELDIHTESWDCLRQWEKDAVAKGFERILDGMTGSLNRLTLAFTGEHVDDFDWPVGVGTMRYLKDITLRNLYVDCSELMDWLNGPGEKVMLVILGTDVRMGDETHKFYSEWDIEDGHKRGRRHHRHCRKLRIQNKDPFKDPFELTSKQSVKSPPQRGGARKQLESDIERMLSLSG